MLHGDVEGKPRVGRDGFVTDYWRHAVDQLVDMSVEKLGAFPGLLIESVEDSGCVQVGESAWGIWSVGIFSQQVCNSDLPSVSVGQVSEGEQCTVLVCDLPGSAVEADVVEKSDALHGDASRRRRMVDSMVSGSSGSK